MKNCHEKGLFSFLPYMSAKSTENQNHREREGGKEERKGRKKGREGREGRERREEGKEGREGREEGKEHVLVVSQFSCFPSVSNTWKEAVYQCISA